MKLLKRLLFVSFSASLFVISTSSHATVTMVKASVIVSSSFGASVDSLVIPLSKDHLNTKSSNLIKIRSLPRDTQVSFAIQHEEIVLMDKEGNALTFMPNSEVNVPNIIQIDDRGTMEIKVNGTLLAKEGKIVDSGNYVGAVKMWVNF